MEDLEKMLLDAMDGTPEDKNKAIVKILLDMRKQDQEDFAEAQKAKKDAVAAAEKAEKDRRRTGKLAMVSAICAVIICASVFALMFGVVIEAETTYSTVEQSTEGGGNAYYNENSRAQYFISDSGEDE